ncbi:hypothetical protein [Noviluteimonas gilva]|uniref:Uncharacterized protein n=1 Tax=Noviluteimonas gilva TaxID=2682097 RepID=A0A7C9HZ16_9GAMM|nr:hypothetical protein [Lysobacter gilvus]MUV14574.1 hypothetical protein [Lysobacter gilvus]
MGSILSSPRAAQEATEQEIPPIFCWTKMGAESGQPLSDIIRRKDLERESGGGVFGWGIGNSVGPAIQHARMAERVSNLQALFTPMKAAPKTIDSAPTSIVMWLAQVGRNEQIEPLPEHMLITSRGQSGSGEEKRGHYALICRSTEPLAAQRLRHSIDHRAVCNLVSSNPVGSSQVTSVVRYCNKASSGIREYPVLFRADLIGQAFVRLAHPVTLSGELLDKYRALCDSSGPDEWMMGIKGLKRAALNATPEKRQQPQLF